MHLLSLCGEESQICMICALHANPLLAPAHALQVTCGGLQSAHVSAVSAALAHAAAAAGQRVRTHLLLRGERPPVLAGHLLLASMHAASVTYVTRAEYADRAVMLQRRREELQAADAGAKVSSVEEGWTGSCFPQEPLRAPDSSFIAFYPC